MYLTSSILLVVAVFYVVIMVKETKQQQPDSATSWADIFSTAELRASVASVLK